MSELSLDSTWLRSDCILHNRGLQMMPAIFSFSSFVTPYSCTKHVHIINTCIVYMYMINTHMEHIGMCIHVQCMWVPRSACFRHTHGACRDVYACTVYMYVRTLGSGCVQTCGMTISARCMAFSNRACTCFWSKPACLQGEIYTTY